MVDLILFDLVCDPSSALHYFTASSCDGSFFSQVAGAQCSLKYIHWFCHCAVSSISVELILAGQDSIASYAMSICTHTMVRGVHVYFHFQFSILVSFSQLGKTMGLGVSLQITGFIADKSMDSFFWSHTWRLPPLLLALACGIYASKQRGINEVTYKHALYWGSAHPDVSGCWENRTFEVCCVKWDSGILPGQSCWPESILANEYERCCVAKPDRPPRSFFSCVGKGVFWERLRQTLSLFQSFQVLNDTPLDKADPKECLLGGVLASMIRLIHVTTVNRSIEKKSRDYDRAEYLLKVLFTSPVTLEEILASGWPLFLSLDFFRWDSGFQEFANQRMPGIMAGDRTMRWSNTLTNTIQGESSGRIPTDLVVKLTSSVARSHEEVLWQLMPVFTALTAYHNLRLDLPRASDQLPALGMEAKRLVQFADAELKAWISLFTHPFSLLIKMEVPLVNLLQALSWPAVVLTRPGTYMTDTIHFPGSRLASIVSERFRKHSDLPLLEQHLHPGFDAASNMVRTTEQPMCYAPGFLFVVLAMAAHSSCDGGTQVCTPWPFPVQVWDIGASYGDCILWAASMLLKHWNGPRLEMRGFEALPSAAAAFRRSAEGLKKAWGVQKTDRGDKGPQDSTHSVEVIVEEMAMRDAPGQIQISFPSHSMALATFHRCKERYSEASNNLYYCVERSTTAETLDTYISGLASEGSVRPVDVLKVHVQGDELFVLRGGRRSLSKNRVCVLHMNLETLSLRTDDAQTMELMADEVLQILEGFQGVLVSLWSQQPATREAVKSTIVNSRNPDKVAWRPPDPKNPPKADEQRHELVAWREEGECSQSLAVAAVKNLWASISFTF